MIRRYTVFGNPIAQSKSPQIHALFAEQTHRAIEYTRTLAEESTFVTAVREFVDSGAQGFNITSPFKQQILPLCDSLSEEASRANAVNTVKIDSDQKLSGYNTDGSGLLLDLMNNLNIEIKQSSILIAGAGGATRGILMPLLAQSPRRLVVVNRTIEKAIGLAEEFSDCGKIDVSNYTDLTNEAFDLIINATSSSLSGKSPPLDATCVNSNTIAYDLSYGKDTEFMQWARAAGAAKSIDGTGMLLEQAADAFLIWEDVRPKTRLISAKL